MQSSWKACGQCLSGDHTMVSPVSYSIKQIEHRLSTRRGSGLLEAGDGGSVKKTLLSLVRLWQVTCSRSLPLSRTTCPNSISSSNESFKPTTLPLSSAGLHLATLSLVVIRARAASFVAWKKSSSFTTYDTTSQARQHNLLADQCGSHSACARAGRRNATPFTHYSQLLTIVYGFRNTWYFFRRSSRLHWILRALSSSRAANRSSRAIWICSARDIKSWRRRCAPGQQSMPHRRLQHSRR
jgi:hypothetical protein